jgi:hypothetical protein
MYIYVIYVILQYLIIVEDTTGVIWAFNRNVLSIN